MAKHVLVFGVFDLLHPGHLYFLKQASNYGKVTVVVTLDEMVVKLKNKSPRQPQEQRLKQIKNLGYDAVLGDNTLGLYSVFLGRDFDIVCLGHDQQSLGKDLHRRKPHLEYIIIGPYKRDIYSTTLLSNM